MGVPPAGAAATKPLVSHRPWTVVSGKTRRAQPRTRTTVSASRGTASHTDGGSNDGGVAENASDVPSSFSDLPLSGIARHAAAALVSAAAASCVLLGEGLPSGSAVAAFVGGVITGGVPVAYADENAREDALAAADAPAPDTRDSSGGAPDAPAAATDLQIVDEVWKVVDDNFLPARAEDGFDRARWARMRDDYTKHPPATRAEAYDVIRDILRSLGDPFSRFVDPAAFAPLLKYDISGVGLNIAEDASDPTRLRVLGLVLDSPAARAGVKQGDELVSVDGVETRNKSAFQAVSLIQASADAEVAVGVRSGETGAEYETRVVTLRRNSSAANPVAFRMEGGNVGYIRLKEFNALAEPNVASAVETLRARGATSFVLDLRDNPGGLVQAGVEIARLFLPPATAVAYTEGRVVAGGVKGDTEVAATAKRNGGGDASTRLKSIPSASAASVTEPLTVLVNGRSASASEILTGALRDNCRATVAGSRTYGKGLIQSVYELSDGSGLVLTVGKYVTPGLHDIDRAGIEPDFAMFPGFEKAGETLRACRVPQSK